MKEFDSGVEGKKEAHEIFRAANELYNMLRHRDVLPEPLEAALKDYRAQLTDIICPYSVEQLDRRVKELEEKLPDLEHRYIRCGTIVTWHGGRKTDRSGS
jgi:hypothetical protein